MKNCDNKILRNACWGLCYIVNGHKEGGAYLVKYNLLPRLLQLMVHEKVYISLASTRLIGDITNGTDENTQLVIDAGGLIILRQLLQNEKFKLRKESCWVLSNIADGTPEQLTALLNADILGLLVEIIKKDITVVKREAIWVINVISKKVKVELIPHFLPYGVIEALCEVLPSAEAIVIKAILEALNNFLTKWREGGFEGNEVANKLETCGGLKSIETLQSHLNKEIAALAMNIITQHFDNANAEEMI